MSDYDVQMAEQRDNDIARYNEWIDENIDLIKEEYVLSLDIEEIPNDFISDLYDRIQEV